MPIEPAPQQLPVAPNVTTDLWADASFYDVTLVRMVHALLASGAYSPGPLVMKLALASASQIMVETKRWAGTPTGIYTMEQLESAFKLLSPKQ